MLYKNVRNTHENGPPCVEWSWAFKAVKPLLPNILPSKVTIDLIVESWSAIALHNIIVDCVDLNVFFRRDIADQDYVMNVWGEAVMAARANQPPSSTLPPSSCCHSLGGHVQYACLSFSIMHSNRRPPILLLACHRTALIKISNYTRKAVGKRKGEGARGPQTHLCTGPHVALL